MASEQWQQEKVQAAILLNMDGRVFMHELPAMLEFWVLQEAEASSRFSEEELTYSLLSALHRVTGTSFGNDIEVLSRLPSVIHTVTNVEDSSLQEQYDHARRLLDVALEPSQFEFDIEEVDQLLIPALLGGSVPLTVLHASEVRKHILRNDTISATKLLSTYALKDDVKFAIRTPGLFALSSLRARLNHIQGAPLFKAMKALGCLGPAVFSDGDEVTVPRGFRRWKGTSLALIYAKHIDEQAENEI